MTTTEEIKKDLARLGYMLTIAAIIIIQIIAFIHMFKFVYDLFLYDLTGVSITKVNIYGASCLIFLIGLKKTRKFPVIVTTIQALKRDIKFQFKKLRYLATTWVVIQIILMIIK